MKRILIMAVALIAIAGTSAFGATFYNLGAGSTTGISDDGQAVAFNSSGGNAYLWSQAYGSVLLGAGTSAGVAYVTYNAPSGKYIVGMNVSGVAKRWDGSLAGVGAITSLPLAGGTSNWTVRATNGGAANVFFGGSTLPSPYAACRYKESANSVASLGLPSGATNNSYVYGISSGGVYAGQSQYGGSPPSGGSRQAIGGSSLYLFNNLEGAPTTSNSASGTAIASDGSRIVGWSSIGVTVPAGGNKACYWNAPFAAGSVPTAIPWLAGHDYARPGAINADGSIIGGFSQNLTLGAAASKTCWIWDAVNGTQDLGQLMTNSGVDLTGWQLTNVTGISADGTRITGVGTYGGATNSFVFVIPEPGSLLALATGLFGFLGLRKRF